MVQPKAHGFFSRQNDGCMMTELFFNGDEHRLMAFIAEQQYNQIILLADTNTNGHCIPLLRNLLPRLMNSNRIVIPSGEQNKTLDVSCLIWNELNRLNAGRSSLLINIGGGMVSDIGGFAASVFKRGMDFINIPTTLLSMTDACYGGKTGIDFNGLKNNLGTFQEPLAIYIHPIFLQTVPDRILKSGLAESVKHALLTSHDQFRYYCQAPFADLISVDAIRNSIAVKMSIVTKDPKDQNLRQTLNLGHTIGHAIESYFLQTNTPLLHGEAVLLGLKHEIKLSEGIFGLSETVLNELMIFKEKHFAELKVSYSYSDIRDFLLHDKKNKTGIRMSLLKNPGDCEIQVLVQDHQVMETFTI